MEDYYLNQLAGRNLPSHIKDVIRGYVIKVGPNETIARLFRLSDDDVMQRFDFSGGVVREKTFKEWGVTVKEFTV